jgi:hypothetical protein
MGTETVHLPHKKKGQNPARGVDCKRTHLLLLEALAHSGLSGCSPRCQDRLRVPHLLGTVFRHANPTQGLEQGLAQLQPLLTHTSTYTSMQANTT